MMDEGFDLDTYLRRIRYEGPRNPSSALLALIVSAHTAAIPYENIDVLLNRNVSLETTSLSRKIIRGGRGGYCFEQNSLLAVALEALGFTVTRLTARVLRGLPASAQPGRGHKLLRIDLPEGVFVADVGFGNLTPTAPLALATEVMQATPHEPCRLMPLDGDFVLQARLGDEWESLFRFSTEPTPMIDFQMANWYASTYPTSAFRSNLFVARPISKGRQTLFNRRLTTRDRNNCLSRRLLDGIDDYRDVLIGEFGLLLDEAELKTIVAEMASHAPEEEVHRAFV